MAESKKIFSLIIILFFIFNCREYIKYSDYKNARVFFDGYDINIDLMTFPARNTLIFLNRVQLYTNILNKKSAVSRCESQYTNTNGLHYKIKHPPEGKYYIFFINHNKKEDCYYLSAVYKGRVPPYGELDFTLITKTNKGPEVVVKGENIRGYYRELYVIRASSEKTNRFTAISTNVYFSNRVSKILYRDHTPVEDVLYKYRLKGVSVGGRVIETEPQEVIFPFSRQPKRNKLFTGRDLQTHYSGLEQYQPGRPSALAAVKDMFNNGHARKANAIFKDITPAATSSYYYWEGVLAYTVEKEPEKALDCFAEVIKSNTYRAEVFRSYIWLSAICLKNSTDDKFFLENALRYAEKALAFSGRSRYKDDAVFYKIKALYHVDRKAELKSYLEQIEKEHLIREYARYFDINMLKELEIIPEIEYYKSKIRY